MPSWAVAHKILRGQQAYQSEPLDRYTPELLPPNERRRATGLVRLAFRVCEEILNKHPEAARQTRSVFASSGGDYYIIDQICRLLHEQQHALSPTQFHNSVHNAAAGYWSIATQSTWPSTSISCYDHTFAAGLLEAAGMVNEANQPVLYAAYDSELPEPLLQKRNIAFPFAAALLLSPEESARSQACISLQPARWNTETGCRNAGLEKLRLGNPAARALPLLELVASQENGNVILALPGDSALQLDVSF
jgi:hypothetical protein